MVSTASTFAWPRSNGSDVEIVRSIRSRDFFLIADLVCVHPDVGVIVDAAEMQPDVTPVEFSGFLNLVRYHHEQWNGLSLEIGR